MEEKKIKRSLFGRLPFWTKTLGVGYLVAPVFAYLICGFAVKEWNPFKIDDAMEMRIQGQREELDLRERRLGPLAGPIKIDVPYVFTDRHAYGVIVGKEVNYEATKREEERVERLGEIIFGEEGYADTNGDNKIDLNELSNAYVRMGLEEQVLRTGEFPDVKAEHLEKAISSYEANN